MRISISALKIISLLGIILSSGAAIYASTYYLALSHSVVALEALTPREDVMLSKVDTMLAEHKAKDLIIDILRSRYEQNSSLHAAFTKVVAESRKHAMNEAILWVGAGAFFFMLLFWAKAR